MNTNGHKFFRHRLHRRQKAEDRRRRTEGRKGIRESGGRIPRDKDIRGIEVQSSFAKATDFAGASSSAIAMEDRTPDKTVDRLRHEGKLTTNEHE